MNMLKHYFKISIRSILKDKVFSIVNILGLAVAVACCLLLIFWVKSETSFEHSYPNAKRTYRILEGEENLGGVYYFTNLTSNITQPLKSNFPQIEAATSMYIGTIYLKIGETETGEFKSISTEEDFLRIFAYEYLEGSPQAAASKYNSAILSQEAARRLFGNQPAVGQILSNNQEVAAVVKVPQNTRLDFDVLSIWGGGGSHYIMLRENEKMTPELSMQIRDFMKTYKGSENILLTQPLYDVHLNSPSNIGSAPKFQASNERYGNKAQMYIYTLAALLILAIAIINYVNTSISRAMSRMKEVGIRKVTGSGQGQLAMRFLFESFIASFIAIILAMAAVELLLPGFTNLMGHKLNLGFDWSSIGIALGACLLITVLSGGYAAFYLSTYSPSAVLRGGTKGVSRDSVRLILLGVQFFISIGILTCTTFVYKQINAIFTSDFGLNRENVYMVSSWWTNPVQYEAFVDIIKNENPDIVEASFGYYPPYNVGRAYKGFQWDGMSEEQKDMEIYQNYVDSRYADLFELEMVEGEFLPLEMSYYETREKTGGHRLSVINEAFRDAMGVESAVDRIITSEGGTSIIVGVVKDFNFKPLKEKIVPINLSFEPNALAYLFVKTSGHNNKATLEYLTQKYKEMRNMSEEAEVDFVSLEENYREMYGDELRTLKILSIFAVISFILSLMGIISMIAFMVEKRTKDIAIRKINGATTWHIIGLFSRSIIRPALIASVLAVPLCYVLMSGWLQDYVYRTPLSWWVFVLVPLGVMIVTLAVIAVEISLIANKNPVESLRSE